jgi:hypothetical protein
MPITAKENKFNFFFHLFAKGIRDRFKHTRISWVAQLEMPSKIAVGMDIRSDNGSGWPLLTFTP